MRNQKWFSLQFQIVFSFFFCYSLLCFGIYFLACISMELLFDYSVGCWAGSGLGQGLFRAFVCRGAMDRVASLGMQQ